VIEPSRTERMQSTVDLPLHPSQAWFLHEMRPAMLNPNRWNLYRVLQLPPGATVDLAREAARAAWHRHEALRASFVYDGQTWRQRILNAATPLPFQAMDLARLEVAKLPEAMAVIIEQAQGALNITTGPLVKFIYVAVHADAEPYLLVMMHHLVSDGLSIWLLTNDLEAIIARRQAGKQDPPLRSAPYSTCVQALQDYASSPALLDELPYWTAQPWDDAIELASESPAEAGHVLRPWTSIAVVMEQEVAGAIIHAASRQGGSLEQMTLAIVMDAITTWGGGAVCVRLLKHGRDLVRGADGPALFSPRVQWTVGWFATAGVAILAPRGCLDRVTYVLRVAEWTTAAPNHGIGLNLLRWLAPPGSYSTAVNRMWAKSMLLFNYLGSVDEDLTKTSDTASPSGGMFDAQSRLPMHVRVAVSANKLMVILDYDSCALSRDAMAHLAELVQDMFWQYAKTLRGAV